ncbi:hypothetical protein RS9916_30882 [Synechococcus sp. RS9916]|nr:hypothetical protein RS9916_30882 [Synechococcus sp. RS9916]
MIAAVMVGVINEEGVQAVWPPRGGLSRSILRARSAMAVQNIQ